MSEYEKKLNELIKLAEWFNTHGQEGDAAIIVGVADENSNLVFGQVQGDRDELVALMIMLAEPLVDEIKKHPVRIYDGERS